MLNYTFVQSVKVLTGRGSVGLLGEALQSAGYKKAFLVCGGKSLKRSGVLDKILEDLKEKGIGCYVYDKAMPDPPAYIINEGASVCKAEGCDCVVGIGGGSAIDSAKGINVMRFNEGSILDYATKPMNLCKGLITVPTTSGTGSELSNGAIVSDTEHDIKMPILCFNNMSEIAILDPELTVGMPAKLTLLTGLDVFSHCYEAYTAVGANPMTDLVCEKLLATVVKYLPIAIKEPENLEAREKMQCAASIGGWMLYNACAHVGHSLAHVIGANLHIIHGAACAYGAPGVLKAIAPAVPAKVKTVGELLGAEFDGSESIEEIGEKTAAAYRTFAYGMGLEPVEKFDINAEMFDKLVSGVVNEPFAGLTPVKVDAALAEKLVKEALAL